MKTAASLLMGLMALVLGRSPVAAQVTNEALLLPDEIVRVASIRPLVTQGTVTGFGFGPGQLGVAYCLQEPTRTGLYLVSADGKRRNTLWIAPQGVKLVGPVRWSPDGLRIALRMMNSDGTSDLLATEYHGEKAVAIQKQTKVIDYLWSPDGKWLACLLPGKDWPGLGLILVSGGEMKTLAAAAADVRWSPTGKSLTWLEPTASGLLSEQREELESDPAPVRPDQPRRPTNTVWSPDGLLCAALNTYSAAEVFGARSFTSFPVAKHPARRLLSFSPDSRLLLAQRGDGQLFLASAWPPDRGVRFRLASDTRLLYEEMALRGDPDLSLGDPSWSPDGKGVALALRPGSARVTVGTLSFLEFDRKSLCFGPAPPPGSVGVTSATRERPLSELGRELTARANQLGLQAKERYRVADLPLDVQTLVQKIAQSGLRIAVAGANQPTQELALTADDLSLDWPKEGEVNVFLWQHLPGRPDRAGAIGTTWSGEGTPGTQGIRAETRP